MPKSCKNVQYDLRKYVSFFKSMPSLLDGELSSISLLEKYQQATSSGFSWEFLLDGPLSDVPWWEDSPGNNPAICILHYNDTAPNIRIQYQVQVLISSSPVDYSTKTQKNKKEEKDHQHCKMNSSNHEDNDIWIPAHEKSTNKHYK